MLRHVAMAVLLFLGIGALTVYLALPPEKPIAAPSSLPLSAPVADGVVSIAPLGDFLPRAALPVMTVQASLPQITARYYHVDDPALLLRLYRGVMQESLSSLALARLLDETLPPVQMRVVTVKNGQAGLDWDKAMAAKPGFYAVTVARDARSPALAASWFLRNDMLILAAEDRETWRVLCQDMDSGAPRSGVKLTWLGVDNAAPLAQAACAEDGRAMLPKTALEQNKVPLLLQARDDQGQTAFVPLRAVRLPSEDVAGTSIFLATDRGHYLPGQKIGVLAIGLAEKADDLTLGLIRPDGLQIAESKPADLQGEMAWQQFALPVHAMAGRWRITGIGADGVRHEADFMVGQTETPKGQSRLRLLSRDGDRVTLAPSLLDAVGAPLREQAAVVTLHWEPVRELPDVAAGFVFGGDGLPESAEKMLAGLVTNGGAPLTLSLPPPPRADTPLQARILLQPQDGMTVEAQPLLVPFPSRPWALGVKAEFAPGDLQGNSKASFRIALFKTAARDDKIPAPDIHYALLTERRSYRWFFADGRWDYKSDIAVAPVLSGAVPLDEGRSGLLTVPVQPGQYRLEAFTPDRKLLTIWRFSVDPALRPPALRDLAFDARRGENGAIALRMETKHTEAKGGLAVIAADWQVREIHVLPQAERRQGTIKLAHQLPQGGYAVMLGASRDEEDIWHLERGVRWIPSQSYLNGNNAALQLPISLTAGSMTSFTISLPTKEKSPRYAQLVAVPLDAQATAQPLTGKRVMPRAMSFAVMGNIPSDWTSPAPEKTPLRPPIMADSSLSALTAIPDSGRAEISLVLPPHGGKLALHLLVWDGTEIGETISLVTPQPSPTVPPAVSAAAPLSVPARLAVAKHWDCHAPLQDGQSINLALPRARAAAPECGVKGKKPRKGEKKPSCVAARDKTPGSNRIESPQDDRAAPSFITLAPLSLPDMDVLLAQLWAAESNRSDVLARSHLALQSYRALLVARGVSEEQFLAWQGKVTEELIRRQRGDGGIAQYADAPQSDLTASAFALLAWQSLPPEVLGAPERLRALQDYLARRLDVAWGAETELYARSDAFYALGVLGKIDPAALRYFVEKYGNSIRHAVFEAELAAALASIGDQEQSKAFALRAAAQLPAMRVGQPQNALQVLQILVHHDLIKPQDAMPLVPEMTRLPPVASAMAAVTGAQLWPELALRLPEWQAVLNGDILPLRGLVGKPFAFKQPVKLQAKGAQPLHVCASFGFLPETASSSASPAPPSVSQTTNPSSPLSLQREIFTPQGQKLKQARLAAGSHYVLVLSVPKMTTGPAEFVLPLPTALSLRAIVPGGTVAGHYAWLKEVDHVQVSRRSSDGLVLALSRSSPGAVRIALLVKAHDKVTLDWPAAQLAQFNETHHGAAETLVIE